jgi:hypothetical protein
MAKQVITLLTDDLDGSEADRTVEFGLDGANCTIDLSDKNAGKLRKALQPYIAAGSRVGRGAVDRRGGRPGRALPWGAGRVANRIGRVASGPRGTGMRFPSEAVSRCRWWRPSSRRTEPVEIEEPFQTAKTGLGTSVRDVQSDHRPFGRRIARIRYDI